MSCAAAGRMIMRRKNMSQNLEKTYNPKEIEPKLYDKWCEKR